MRNKKLTVHIDVFERFIPTFIEFNFIKFKIHFNFITFILYEFPAINVKTVCLFLCAVAVLAPSLSR